MDNVEEERRKTPAQYSDIDWINPNIGGYRGTMKEPEKEVSVVEDVSLPLKQRELVVGHRRALLIKTASSYGVRVRIPSRQHLPITVSGPKSGVAHIVHNLHIFDRANLVPYTPPPPSHPTDTTTSNSYVPPQVIFRL
ncbi:hypothetical protein Pcinc_019257 [Petrolisthes cinctipes]|uniref:Uncharacterized protein n=1 Tax=Petrolisthes cinctipes TaxID=88211 RepID=A0AAE1FKN1_PETCI|nr:hypothetical protein Pcinc_019257 [Petrolisthes cinctipes]